MTVSDPPGKLAAFFEVGCPNFVLVDPLVGEPVPLALDDASNEPALQRAREAAWQRPVHRVVLAPHIELSAYLQPYLVALEGPDDVWWQHTLEIASSERSMACRDGLEGMGLAPYRIGGWLGSSRSPEDLAQVLAGLMCVGPHVRAKTTYLRLGDRRALEWLRLLIGEASMSAALGAIQCWVYLDLLGGLSALRRSNEEAQPLRPTVLQWQEFMLGSLLHPTLARWLGELGRPEAVEGHRPTGGQLLAPDIPRLYQQAKSAVERAQVVARRWPRRFTQPVDLTAWASLSLLHPGLEQNHAVAALLDATVEPGEPTPNVQALCASIASASRSASEPSQ